MPSILSDKVTTSYEYIHDTSDIPRVLAWLADTKVYCVDTETTGLDPFIESVVLLQFGNQDKQWIIDTRVIPIEAFKGPLEERDSVKIGQNLKFDAKFLLRKGIRIRNVVDTMINEQVIRCGLRVPANMEALAERYLLVQLDKDQALRKSFRNTRVGQFSSRQLEYAAGDVIVPQLVAKAQKGLIESRGLKRTINLESAFVPILAKMEMQGMGIDKNAWMSLYQKALIEKRIAERQLDSLFGITAFSQEDLFNDAQVVRSINYNSNKQLPKVLAEKGFTLESVDQKDIAYAAITGKLPLDLARALLAYKRANTKTTRYGLNFLSAIHPVTGRIHSDFTQTYTTTGRLSSGKEDEDEESEKVNLQNIAKASAYRGCFIPAQGNKFAIWDYQAIEPRILGETSQDPMYLNSFRNKLDIYAEIGTPIYHEEVSKKPGRPSELRDQSKIGVLGNSYGQGEKKFHKKLNLDINTHEGMLKDIISFIPKEESEKLRHGIFEVCPLTKQELDRTSALADPISSSRRVYDDLAAAEDPKSVYAKCIDAYKNSKRYSESELKDLAKQLVARRGYLTYSESLNGRKRYFKVYHSSSWTEGRNQPIQASAADIIKVAMIEIDKVIEDRGYKGYMVNQVHDENITEGPEDEMQELSGYIHKAMVSAGERFLKSVPCVVEGGVADRWKK